MKLDDLKKNYPPVSAAGHAQFMRTLANLKEEEPVKKKLSLSLALALVLILALAATAIALVTSYSVKDHIDPKFIDQVTQIDQSYENDYLSLSINDALADAKSLFVAMNMTHKPGAPEVYVFPFVTAESQGKALDVDIESGFDFYDGAWLPERAPSSEGPGNYSLDMAIMEDRMPGAQDDITWTLTFHVLKPNWPIETDQYSARGYYEGEGKIAHEDYEQLFRDAYKNKKILLTYNDTTVEYSAYLPLPEGLTEEEHLHMRMWERLVVSGAFSEVDRFSRSFTTKKGERKDALEQTASYDFKDYTLTVDQVSLTPIQMEARFTITAKRPDVLAQDEVLYFEARGEDGAITATGFSFGSFGGSADPMGFIGSYDTKPLKTLPDEVTFVPYIRKTLPQGPGKNALFETSYQEENAFTVKVGQ